MDKAGMSKVILKPKYMSNSVFFISKYKYTIMHCTKANDLTQITSIVYRFDDMSEQECYIVTTVVIYFAITDIIVN